MSIASTLGFPRIGRRRELKFALERYWGGTLDDAGLQEQAAALRVAHWQAQQGRGLGHVPSHDAALYDHVLDTACLLGAIPPGYGWTEGPVALATYFALARGSRGTEAEAAARIAPGLPALEMTKWFDTNYHYLVPRLSAGQRFALTRNRPLDMLLDSARAGIRTRPVLLGPVSFLLLSKTTDGSDPLDLLAAVLPVYAQILAELAQAGCAWVQIDEPVLALDLPEKARVALALAYGTLARGDAPDILLASYFGPLGDNLGTAVRLPVSGLHVDLVRGAADLPAVLDAMRPDQWLSLGIVNGRNVWRADLRTALGTLRRVASARNDTRRLMVAPSCSLLHVPMDAAQEQALDPKLRFWLAFAVQKLAEVSVLTRGLDEGEAAIRADLESSDAAAATHREAARAHAPEVSGRVAAITPALARRATPFPQRRLQQRSARALPAFPTTTIGSFPQTAEVRDARAAVRRGERTASDYDAAIAGWITDAVRLQERIGLDVLVHGEFERNDMVQYFGERLDGYAFTQHGWVQSYGSRCVAPPIIWGDVARPAPMTVRWSAFAQSLTDRPMKGMLTGPVTMLFWSFVRDDIPLPVVCRQIALALRDEVADLERAGIGIIQVDEPAFREGLPLRRADWPDYLRWAVECFGLATACVRDATAIHTHMCYAAFNDIMPAIAAMDADAISIETTRSRMELLDAFAPRHANAAGGTVPADAAGAPLYADADADAAGGGTAYPAEIGPGVWDIHSPRIPDVAEMAGLLALARDRLEDWQIWVNPDCGLKTRTWPEVRPALENMVAAARQLRAEA